MLSDAASLLDGLDTFSDSDSDESEKVEMICDESGCALVVPVKAPEPTQVMAAGPVAELLICTPWGCSVPEDGYEAPEPSAGDDGWELHEGKGWELRYRKVVAPGELYVAELASRPYGHESGWAVELTAAEYNAFCNLLQTLKRGVATMDEVGEWSSTARAKQVLELSQGGVRMQAEATRKHLTLLRKIWRRRDTGEDDVDAPTAAFRLRFEFNAEGQRGVQGCLPDTAVMGILDLMDRSGRPHPAVPSSGEAAVAPVTP